MLQGPADILFGEYRRRVLGLLLLHPERSYHVREIARATGTTAGTLHKELTKLAAVGILANERRGNQLAYRANRTCPIFDELASIMRKTSGLADIIARALEPLAAKVKVAFVFGSLARATESTHSDVDLMVIGDVGFGEVVQLLYSVQADLGREINPKVFAVEEWNSKVVAADPFVVDVLSKPKIFLQGGSDELGELGGDQPG
ncbi:MAG: nucleotidyltransferase domain-containing protein [Coriobacteriia bacterium]